MSRRVVVELTPVEGGWNVTYDGDSRRLRAELARGFGRIPMPADATAPTLTELAEMLRRLDRNAAQDGDATAVGRHLLACLFDPATWTGLHSDGDDLQLVLATAEPELHRLPWELLHDGQGFLAARSSPLVTISRVVGHPSCPTEPVRIAPVILVVVGGAIDEAALQPAAEYLALLDTLRQGELALHADLVVNATIDDVRAACEQLRPDVVHVIAHGDQRAGGEGYVELAPAKRGEKPSKVDATQLLGLLRTGDSDPQMLILTACRSASTGMAAPSHSMPQPFTFQHSLAAECVLGGVPIVSAMTGAITSRACREFTLGFYGALLRGGDAVDAAANGRRFAFVATESAGRAIDWAYPAVFCGSGFDGRVEVTDAAALAARAIRARAMLDRFRSPLAFCGRHDVLDAFHRLLTRATSAQPGVLAICVPRDVATTTRLGASRTLAQLGASASLAGWAVARLAHDIGDNRAVGFRQLAGQLVRAARRSSTAVGAKLPGTDQVILLERDQESPELHPELRELLDYDQVAPNSEQAIGRALVLDLAAIRRAIVAADPASRGLVLLVDDLHKCGPGVAPLLVRATSDGLGTSADPVPLVFSYREGDDVDGSGAVESVVAFMQQGRAKRVEIKPFALPAAALAYQQLLLGGVPPLVPVAEHREDVLEEIHISSGGVPYEFDKREVLATIRTARRLKAVEEATDAERLEMLLRRQS